MITGGEHSSICNARKALYEGNADDVEEAILALETRVDDADASIAEEMQKLIEQLKARQMPVRTEDLVLCRSDTGDGGWSLHAPGSTDEDIASGDAPYLVSGDAEQDEKGNWSRPNEQDYREAMAALARA